MTKKHFIALADMIKNTNDAFGTDAETFGFSDGAIKSLADFCQSQNPNFNRKRWLSYIAGECCKNGGKVKQAV